MDEITSIQHARDIRMILCLHASVCKRERERVCGSGLYASAGKSAALRVSIPAQNKKWSKQM